MAKKKTTVYMDSDVLTVTKAGALTSKRSESAVIEDALRFYLRSGHGDSARDELQDLLKRVALASDLGGDAALAQAVDQVRAVRQERRSRSVRGTRAASCGLRYECVRGSDHLTRGCVRPAAPCREK